MSTRTITLHTFCSVKGGVGKSALAVACAKLLAGRQRVPVLIDCHMTGTSLADGLRLCAPKVVLRADGSINLDAAPTGEFHTLSETRLLRSRRGAATGQKRPPPPPPYLNDALVHEGDARVGALLWRHERDDGVRYLPSSSLHRDLAGSLDWFDGEPFDWSHRVIWLLDSLISQLPSLTDVILDLPPGMWGFAHETHVLVSTLSFQRMMPEGFPTWHEGSVAWEVNPFLVLSADGHDLVPALEYVARNGPLHLPALVPLVNRATETITETRARARELLGPALEMPGVPGIEDKLQSIGELRSTLGRMFVNQDLNIDEEMRKLAGPLRLEGFL